MIKEDAIVRDSNGEICIVSGVNKHGITVEYNNGGHCEDSDFLEHGSYEVIEDIRGMYEQQKQRADELEKQNDILKHNIRVELDSNRDMYIGMCDEKQRADEYEKRWSELKDKTIETYVGLRKMKSILAQHIGSILCVMDELEGKDNVFETVQRLEEDGE